jgi:hypothetical protein
MCNRVIPLVDGKWQFTDPASHEPDCPIYATNEELANLIKGETSEKLVD